MTFTNRVNVAQSPIFNPWELFPTDIVRVILAYYCYEWSPLLQHVCITWRTVVESHKIPTPEKECVISRINNDDDNNGSNEDAQLSASSSSCIGAICAAGVVHFPCSLHDDHEHQNNSEDDDDDDFDWIQQADGGSCPLTLPINVMKRSKSIRTASRSVRRRLFYGFEPATSNDHDFVFCPSLLVDLAYRGKLNALMWLFSLRPLNYWSQVTITALRIPFAIYCVLFDWYTAHSWNKHGVDIEPQKLIDCIMFAAASGGHTSIVQWSRDYLGATDVAKTMMCAAYFGQLDIIRLCVDQYGDVTDLAPVLDFAAKGGHERVVRFCYDRDHKCRKEIVSAMAHAAQYGHECIVRLCYEEYGCKENIDNMLLSSSFGGHVNMVRLCMELCDAAGHMMQSSFIWSILTAAIIMNHQNVVRLLYEQYGENDPEYLIFILQGAVTSGKINLVRDCVERWGVTSNVIRACLHDIITYNRIEIARLCLDSYAPTIADRQQWASELMVGAAKAGHLTFAHLMLKNYKATGLQTILQSAIDVGALNVVQWCFCSLVVSAPIAESMTGVSSSEDSSLTTTAPSPLLYTQVQSLLRTAIQKGHSDIVIWLMDTHAKNESANANDWARFAYQCNCFAIIRLFIVKYGATNTDDLFFCAAQSNNEMIVSLFLNSEHSKMKPSNSIIQKAFDYACKHKTIENYGIRLRIQYS